VNVTQNVAKMANEIKLRMKAYTANVFGFKFLFHHEQDVSHEEIRKIHLIFSTQEPKKKENRKKGRKENCL
jgi:hypothetical protein